MAKRKSKDVFDEARKAEQAILAGETDPFGDSGEQAIAPRKERPKGMTVVSSGAGYHDFVKEPVYEGSFVDKFLAPKDMKGLNGEKIAKGDCIGYNFVDEHGKLTIIGRSYSITDALEKDGFKTNTNWWIEFEGKSTLKNGKPFNKYYIAKH